jgi:hypothetical protein
MKCSARMSVGKLVSLFFTEATHPFLEDSSGFTFMSHYRAPFGVVCSPTYSIVAESEFKVCKLLSSNEDHLLA